MEPVADGKVSSAPGFDLLPETSIILARQQGRLVGTLSITIDSAHGLPSDQFFAKETAKLRRSALKPLTTAWRIAVDPQVQRSSELVLGIMTEGFNLLRALDSEFCLATFAPKHVRVYRRLVAAELLAEGSFHVGPSVAIPMSLMQMKIEDGWHRFQKLTTKQ